MLRIGAIVLGVLALTSTPLAAERSVTLRGSSASMLRQNLVAKELDYTFLRTGAQVRDFAERGYLVPVEGDENFELANVSFPYARAELGVFIARLAAQYREGCGEKLVVTSLTRPKSSQPSNAHQLSVHPAGMAVDLRISERSACREWLESTLLALEAQDLLDVTRERNPPHYHVAVFPDAYAAHVARLAAADPARGAPGGAVSDPAGDLRQAAPLAAGFVASPAQETGSQAQAIAFLAGLALLTGLARYRVKTRTEPRD